MAATVDKKYLSIKDYLIYGISNFFGSSIAGLTQGYLLIFYTTILKVNPLVVGTMFLIAKIWDGVNDPIEGSIIDRTKSRFGKLRPYLIYLSIPYGIMTILLFLPVNFGSTLNIVYMYVTYFVWCSFYTFVDAPLQALPSVSSPNNEERTKMISFGRLCGSAGGESALVFISLGAILSKSLSMVYLGTAVVLAVCGASALIAGGKRIKENIPPVPVETHNVFEGFRYLGRNKPLLLLISGNFLSFFRNIISASIVYVVTYIFLKPQSQLLFAIPVAIGSFVGMVIPPFIIKKLSGRRQYILSTLFLSAVMTILFFVGKAYMNLYLIAGMMFFMGIPTGVLNVVPTLMCADTLDYMQWKEGTRQEGITFSLMSLRSKVASGFKDFTMTLILTWIGFTAMGTGELIPGKNDLYQQSERTQQGIFLMFTLIPAVFNLLSIVPFFFYKLDGRFLSDIREELALRRQEESNVRTEIADEIYH
jgi:sugar (glycoside-pentoside-hexuronide) transporter